MYERPHVVSIPFPGTVVGILNPMPIADEITPVPDETLEHQHIHLRESVETTHPDSPVVKNVFEHVGVP